MKMNVPNTLTIITSASDSVSLSLFMLCNITGI